MQEKYGFVYLWFDKKRKKYYLGSHWGTENDGYICSSNSMRQAYKRRPGDFRRRILSRIISSRKDTFIKEGEWLSLIKVEELGRKYYNFKNKIYDKTWYIDEDKKKSVGEKISRANKGKKQTKKRVYTEEGLLKVKENTRKIQKLRTYGPATIETRKKQSDSRLEYFENGGERINSGTWKKGQKPWNHGKKLSDETRQKLSESHKGHVQSEETKEKRRKKLTGRIFIHNKFTLECKMILESELKIYLNNGFDLGRPKIKKSEK